MPAAHTLTLSPRKERQECPKRYWDYDFTSTEPIDEETAAEELQRLFEQAVDRHLVADVEVGTYLSGGLDSASIACVAATRIPNLRTFTCGFDLTSAQGLELGFDERPTAEYLSYLYKTEHYEVLLKAGDMERVMRPLIWHLEDPRVGQSYPNFYVARLASRFGKVVLSGTGGDELFAGYPWRYYSTSKHNADTNEYLEKYYSYWQRLLPDEIKPSFFRPALRGPVLDQQMREVFKSVFNGGLSHARTTEDYVNASLYFELKTFLHGLLLVEDKLSMAHGLETRVPFLDNDLVDFAMSLPVHLKLRSLQAKERIDENTPGRKADNYTRRTNDGKLILRRVLSRYVPDRVARAPKQGFSAPDRSWFKGESVEYLKTLFFNSNARIYEYLEPGTVRDLLWDHFRGEQNRRLLIWSFLCFEWWLRLFDPVA